MAKSIKNTPFAPDWVVTPGEMIAERLQERHWTQAMLADRLGVSAKHVNRVIGAHVPISADLAQRLSHVLGSSTDYWLNLEACYQADLLREKEAKELEDQKSWLKPFPLAEMRKRGLIRAKTADIAACTRELLRFFAVADLETFTKNYNGWPTQAHQAFRLSEKRPSDDYALAAWMREGELAVEAFNGPKYTASTLKDTVTRLAQMTHLAPEDFDATVEKELTAAGVAFAVIPAYPRAAVSGVARFFNQDRPLVLLSDYGKSMDKMWFNLFHELGHVLLHLTNAKNRKERLFIDVDTPHTTNTLEDEANTFARETLIPPRYAAQLPTLKTDESIQRFADEIGIHPGIVVGRLQHEELISYRAHNKLKQRYEAKTKH